MRVPLQPRGSPTEPGAVMSFTTAPLDLMPPRQGPVPVPDDAATLDEFLGAMEDLDKRRAALQRLFGFMRALRQGRMVVTSVSLQKALHTDDASVLVEQLDLFQTVFTLPEFAQAVQRLLAAFSHTSSEDDPRSTHLWVLSTLVRLPARCPAVVLCPQSCGMCVSGPGTLE